MQLEVNISIRFNVILKYWNLNYHKRNSKKLYHIILCRICSYYSTGMCVIVLFADTDRRYRATEKLLHAEEEYHEALCSARELYARPLARSYPEFHDVIFQPVADLSRVSAEHCQRVSPSTRIHIRQLVFISIPGYCVKVKREL